MGSSSPIVLPSFSNVVLSDISTLALPTLVDIQTRLATINANAGNAGVVAQQWIGIQADINALALSAPLSGPVLFASLISYGSGEGANLLGELIAALKGLSSSSGSGSSSLSGNSKK